MTDLLDFINYTKRINTMSLEELMAEGNKLIACVRALENKERSKKLACQSRSKLIPKNATIRKEFVKCKKPNCYHKKHGPYYYAYWKDPETKRLKKKYIGRHFERVNLSANMEQAETGKLTPNQPELNQRDKKKKKKKVLVYA
jgi:hypothetical protein